MAPSSKLVAGLCALGSGVIALPHATPGNHGALLATNVHQHPVGDKRDLSSAIQARSCEGKRFKLGWENDRLTSEGNFTNVDTPSTYHNFLFSAGWAPVPPGSPASALRKATDEEDHVLSYTPDSSVDHPRGEITTTRSDKFNAYGAFLGCEDPRKTEDDCHMTIKGFRDGRKVAEVEYHHVPSCGKACSMKSFTFPNGFRNLTSIQMSAKDDGMPRTFVVDELDLAWMSSENCPALTIPHQDQPASTPVTDATAVSTGTRNVTYDFESDDINLWNGDLLTDDLWFLGGGWRVANGLQSPFDPATSSQKLLQFSPAASSYGQRGARLVSSYLDKTFSAYSAFFGCTNGEDGDCNMALWGNDNSGVAYYQKFTIPACGADNKKRCQLKQVSFAGFEDMLEMTLTALDDGNEKEFWIDNLLVGFADQSAQPSTTTSTIVVREPTSSAISVATVVDEIIVSEQTSTTTSTSTQTPAPKTVLIQPVTHLRTMTHTFVSTVENVMTMVQMTTTLAPASTTTISISESMTTTTKVAVVAAPATPSPVDGCDNKVKTLMFEDGKMTDLYHGFLFDKQWSIAPVGETPFRSTTEDKYFARFAPYDSKSPNATIMAGPQMETFDAYATNLGCSNTDGDSDCNVVLEGFFNNNDDTVKQEFTIPACRAGDNCQLARHEFTDKFRGLTALRIHVKDSGNAMDFWMDNLEHSSRPFGCLERRDYLSYSETIEMQTDGEEYY